MDFFGFFFFNSENKTNGSFQSASEVLMKVHRGSIQIGYGFNLECIRDHNQMNRDALSIDPFETSLGPYFDMKKIKIKKK